jgi:hypothetical protein
MQLLAEIEKVKDAQLAGYAKGGGGSSAATNEKIQLNLNALAALDAADFYNDGRLLVECVNIYRIFCHCFYDTFLLSTVYHMGVGGGVKNSSNKRDKYNILMNISCFLSHNNRPSRGCH